MKKNDIIELIIEDLSADGSGVGRMISVSGMSSDTAENRNTDRSGQEHSMIFFVKDALTGDKIRARILKLKKNYGYARLLELLEPSPDRVEPKCPLHRKCGGCQIQALSYEKQLEYKLRKVKNNLARIGGFDADQLNQIGIGPVIGMKEPFYYRNKAQFPVGRDKNGKLAAGFYAARTHSIIPADNCYLGVPENQQVMKRILSWMEQYAVEPYDETSGTGLVRHVLIRYGFRSKQLMVCIVINGTSIPKKDALTDALVQIEGMSSISICINTQRSNVIMGETVETIWGSDFIEDSVGNVKFQISPLSFYQVNPVQTEVLYRKVMEYADLHGNETVWDLYCGIGTISLFLAQKAGKVYGIEIVPQAVEDARRNAGINGIYNAEFFAGEAETLLEQMTEGKVAGTDNTVPAADVVVVDPPRKGCAQKLLDTIVRMQPGKVVYVSCDSATLARDLKYLCGKGYVLQKGAVVDQFCQTVHVETVCCLTRIK